MKIDIKWFQLSVIKLLKLFLENKDTTQVNEVFYLEFPADLVTFTEEILHGKLNFLWQWNQLRHSFSVSSIVRRKFSQVKLI